MRKGYPFKAMRSHKFGPWAINELSINQGQSTIGIIPGYGAGINHLKLNGRSIINGFRAPQELKDNTFFKNSWLFPFANRLSQGQYRFLGKMYQLPVNDPYTGHALHGFLYDRPFDIVVVEEGEYKAEVSLIYDYKGEVSGYPFPCQVTINYCLLASALVVTISIKNTAAGPMPCAPGFHPYFTFDDQDVSDYDLHFPDCNQVVFGDDRLPESVGERIQGKRNIGRTPYDHAFILDKGTTAQMVGLSSANSKDEIYLDFSHPLIRYFQIYTPPDRQSVAIEPMTGNVDCFNNQEGLIILDPEDMLNFQFEITSRTNS